MRVIPLGLHSSPLHDFYHSLLKTSWPRFFLVVGIAYFGTDFLFGLAYWLSNGLEPQPISLADAFFFSVQMLTTGYGDVYAHSLFANWVATLEPFVGLLGFALVTGLTFARISQPTARIQFSHNAVVSNFHGKPTLMFRMANQRHNNIVEAEVHVVLARDEVSPEGLALRRFYDLKPVRSRTTLFRLTWTVMHRLEDGILVGREELMTLQAEGDFSIVASVTGLDTSFHQTVHARHVYRAEDILFNRSFVDIIERQGHGTWSVDYSRFDETVE